MASINSRFGADGSDDRVLRMEPKLDALIGPEGDSGGARDGEAEDSEPDSTVLVVDDDTGTVLEDVEVGADPDVESAVFGADATANNVLSGVDMHAGDDRVDDDVLDAVLAGAVQAAQDEAVQDEVAGEFLDEDYSSDDVDMRRNRQLALYRAARADGFSGPRWDALAIELMRYGLSVMEAWLTTGLILKKVAYLGRPVTLRDHERELLATDPHERTDLADAVVAAAIEVFQVHLQRGTGWKPDGTTLITTYFAGRCALEFNNQFNAWRTNLGDNWRTHYNAKEPEKILEADHDMVDRSPSIGEPEYSIVLSDETARALQLLTQRQTDIVQLKAQGYAHVEIAEMLDTTPKGVEGVLRRLHEQDIRSQLEGNHGE